VVSKRIAAASLNAQMNMYHSQNAATITEKPFRIRRIVYFNEARERVQKHAISVKIRGIKPLE
jgi:hypothetical protein